MKDVSIDGIAAAPQPHVGGPEMAPDGQPPVGVEPQTGAAAEENPYIERLGQMVSLLGEVQGPNVDIQGRFLLKLVTGSNRVPREDFQLFYEAAKDEPRIKPAGDFTYRFNSDEVDADMAERHEGWDGKIDGLDVRGLVDEVVQQSQRSAERSVNFRSLLAQVPGICGVFLNEVQFTVFRMLLDSHEGVVSATQSQFVLAPKLGSDRKQRDLYTGGPLESETIKELPDLEGMLRVLRKESGVPGRRRYSRRRLHYKRGANMDGSQDTQD